MNLDFNRQKAFIIGSTSGIGYAIAKSLASLGCKVVLNGRTQESVDNAIAKLCEEVPEAICSGLVCDFSEPSQIDRLMVALGSVDILVNNVGIYSDQDFFETSDKSWNEKWEVNVMREFVSAKRYYRRCLRTITGAFYSYPANAPFSPLRIFGVQRNQNSTSRAF
jgi:NAD(P)-dependent dehydrogenase (short-subunit alcohol dehydrogenase family)